MSNNRRDFLRITGLLGTGFASGILQGFAKGPGNENGEVPPGTAAIPGEQPLPGEQSFNMCGYAAPKLDVVRIGFVGLGNRGGAAVPRINHIDGVSINALCDIRPEKAQAAKDGLKGSAHNPVLYSGKEDEWKRLCERSDIDLVYIATPWSLHATIATYAMTHGKHVAVEVPSARTLEECWQMVEASEKNRRHCVILENCCYDFFELLTLNMARQGFFGEIVHCEGGYLHDLAPSLFEKDARYDYWRLRENAARNGNLYPTHGLGPLCQIMNINRGDRMDHMVSVSTNDFMMAEMAREAAAKNKELEPFVGSHFRGNFNVSTIRTYNGKVIIVQHDVTSPRPYSRMHIISGTKAIAEKYPDPPRIAVSRDGWVSDADFKKLEQQYTLPIVDRLGEMARQVGGHGGMDFLMDWRLMDCLRNGLPMDHDVYDAALWSAIAPLSEWSVAHRSAPVDVPDFTRGAWKTNKPVDMSIAHGNLTSVK
jgi:predicted dehydrogenase